MFVKLSIVAAIAALVQAAPSPSPLKHVLHEKRSSPPTDWVKGERIEGSAIIPMRIGLAQTNLDKGYDLLMDVSHPDSENFGRHWTPEQVHDMFSPKEEVITSIKEWLTDFGIHSGRVVHSDNKGWIAVDVTVQEAEALLLTEFHEHEHKHSPKVRVGCDEYHVPEHLAEHIDYITPGIKLTPVVKRSVKKTKRGTWEKRESHSINIDLSNVETTTNPNVPAAYVNCTSEMTIACLKFLYSIPDATKATPGHSLGLFEQGDYFGKEDLDQWYAAYQPNIPQGTYPVNASIDGATYSVPKGSPLEGGEAEIDIELAIGLIYPQTVTLYQVDDDIYEPQEVATTNVFNTFLDALDGSYCTYTSDGETGDDPTYDAVYPHNVPGGYLGKLQCGVYTPAKVISASYGQAESDLPAPYVKRQCNEFMKLGLQGISILFASGDYGVASFPGDIGTAGSSGCLGPKGEIFNPQYPSGCPYVTSVGGTQLNNTVVGTPKSDATILSPEAVMYDHLSGSAYNFSSSGGFSNYFPRPTYQDGHVSTYFHRAHLTYPYYTELNVDVSTTSGLYSRYGRAYPDVSAFGAYFPSFINGKLTHFFGASLASPIFAAVLTLINEERAAIGKSSVGFVNPTLYKHDDVMNDITLGTNVGCGSQGFKAVEGWDPATGLGTPNYPKMLALYLSLP